MDQPRDDRRAIERIALIGNFLPRRCGIATYTTDSWQALRDRFPDVAVDVYAMDDHPGRYAYPPAVVRTIDQDDRASYLDAARRIADSGAEAVWLQHEYGIYGGTAGSHILALLDRLTVPLVVTLHTILDRPNADERAVMDAILSRAARVIVMAERGRDILERVHGVHPKVIRTIPHGVPGRELLDSATVKPRFGFEGREVVTTFGLLAPNKGIETIIAAMPAIVAARPDALYVVLGATHPNLVAYEGEAYRERLKAQADSLGVGDHVRFVDGFLEQDELLDYLAASDVYVTPYTNPAQITSGTLSYAIGMGKAVVSTPYAHATEILADGHGALVDFGDADGFAREIIHLLAHPRDRAALERRAYARGRTMTWTRNAEAVMQELANAVAASPRRLRGITAGELLAPDISAVERMTDATGMLQHSVYSVPDRRHGYCIDDNARALMLMNMVEPLDAATRDRFTTIYAAFVQYAWNEDSRRFRNFMNFDRNWSESEGSEDSNGRALWALGRTARDGHSQKLRDWAAALYDRTVGIAFDMESPRTHAFAMLGAAAMLDAHPGHTASQRVIERFGETLLALAEKARRPEWRWFEIVLAYDNCRLPEALIRGGLAIGRKDFVACGLDTLDWIIAQQTSPEGRFRAVGSESFGRVYAPPLQFDQQPLEAQATVDACEAAHDATGDARWIDEGLRAYRWYLGANDLGLPLATVGDGGCFDGLQPNGLNRNQGAESILALQMASCVISGLSKRVRIGEESATAAA